MKRMLAVILTSCMIAGLVSPAGAGVMTEIRANTEAALNNLSASTERTEVAAEGADNFDQTIRDLYDNSMSVTDEEIIASAQMMNSDFEAVKSEMGEEALAVIDYLKYYEAAKSSYISGSGQSGAGFGKEVTREWDRQGEYTSYVMPAEDMIRTMVPRIKVIGCASKNGTANLDIYEWMTVGYASDNDSAVNATAYGYNFSLRLDSDLSGSWKIAAVEDTDQNFDWMQEEVEYSLQAGKESADALRVVSEDGTQEMMAAAAVRTYNYNVNAAVAYADKYCINYNSAYNSYKGKGGDCANFVSQCLFAGGFLQDSVWYKHSVAWINVMRQIAHFKQYGQFLNANNGNILKGNPIYFDWNGDNTYDHATICVGRNNSGTAILDSHTKDLYHATWTNWDFEKAATIQLRTAGTAPSTSSEGGYWKQDSTGWWYEYADGSYISGCFKTIDGQTYYFNSRGYCVTGLQKIGGYYYFFNPTTCAMCYGWVEYEGDWYYFDDDGTACTGWMEIRGKWYYLNPYTCKMATGFCTIKNKTHYFGEDGAERFGWIKVDEKWYYLDQYGVMQYGWKTIGGKQYFFDTNGVMVIGIVSVDGVIYSFDENGACQGRSSAVAADIIVNTLTGITTTTENSAFGKTGFEESNGKTYYYKYGRLQKGWLLLANKYYYFGSDGAMVTGWLHDNDRWYYLAEDGIMQTGWLELGNHYFYLDELGRMATGWRSLSGKWYYFDLNGYMKTGWVKVDGKWYYLASNGSMRTGWLKLGNNYFYLNSNGVMKTGWHLDRDGNYYYLRDDGVMVTGQQVIDGKTYYFNSMGALVS